MIKNFFKVFTIPTKCEMNFQTAHQRIRWNSETEFQHQMTKRYYNIKFHKLYFFTFWHVIDHIWAYLAKVNFRALWRA